MQIAVLGRFITLATVVAAVACSRDGVGPTVGDESAATANGVGGKGDTTVVSTTREWHLKTIRGVVLGLGSAPGRSDTLQFAQYGVPGTAIAGATIEIRKFTLPSTDLGVVTTITSDAAGKFEYVIGDPLIVRTGQPSPNTTYRLTIRPPAGSPFAKRTAAQVIFAEQFPATQTVWEYYVFRP
jgi:hypothetical protein